VVSSQGAKDVMEPDYARVQTEIFRVVATNSFHVEFFPTVTIFGVGWIRVGFLQRRCISFLLTITRIDTRTRSVEITLYSVHARGFDRVEIDERVVTNDYGFVVFDKPNAAHVCRESVNLVDLV